MSTLRPPPGIEEKTDMLDQQRPSPNTTNPSTNILNGPSSSPEQRMMNTQIPYGYSGYIFPPSNPVSTEEWDSSLPNKPPSFESRLIKKIDPETGITTKYLPLKHKKPDHLFGLKGMLRNIRNKDPGSHLVTVGMDFNRLGGLALDNRFG